MTPEIAISAAQHRLPKGAAFSGVTAAFLHGLDSRLSEPIEVTVPPSTGVAARAGMRIRRASLAKDDVVVMRGLPVTSVTRTLRDLCRRSTLTEAVVFCDSALNRRLIGSRELRKAALRASGSRGVATFRDALEHIEPAAESPMETRLRMLLVLAGLPRPEAQVEIRDRWLRVIGRLDLYYRERHLGLEYDGSTHRESLAEDNRRQNRLLDAGVRLLRFTAGDIYSSPEVVVNQVRHALEG